MEYIPYTLHDVEVICVRFFFRFCDISNLLYETRVKVPKAKCSRKYCRIARKYSLSNVIDKWLSVSNILLMNELINLAERSGWFLKNRTQVSKWMVAIELIYFIANVTLALPYHLHLIHLLFSKWEISHCNTSLRRRLSKNIMFFLC